MKSNPHLFVMRVGEGIEVEEMDFAAEVAAQVAGKRLAQLPAFLLKLSGEALGGEAGVGIEPEILKHYCDEIEAAHREGIKLAVVLGGGNLFRGAHLAAAGMDRVIGDRMGMLATVMNGLALNDFLRRRGIASQLFSAVPMPGMVEVYNRDTAKAAMQNGAVVILTGGTGNPFFTTDTAACLRAVELGVDAILKATNVDGVYSSDPKKDHRHFALNTSPITR